MSARASIDRRTLGRNAAANWAAFAVQVLVAFFLSPILVHHLEDQRYGIWSLVESILAYLVLLDLGIAASVVRFVAKFDEAQDPDEINRVFSCSLCIFAAGGLVAAVAAIVIAGVVLPYCTGIPQELTPEAQWLLILLGLNFGFGLPLSVYSCLLDALGRYPAKSGIRTAMLLARSAVILLVVLAGYGLIALGLAITVCGLAENALVALAAKYYLPSLHLTFRGLGKTFSSIRGYTVDAFVAMVAGRISFQTDAIVIGIFLAAKEVTYFAIAARLVEYAKESLRAVTTVLTPAVSVLETQGRHDAIRLLFCNSTRYALWLILPLQAGLMTLGRPFLVRWMGERYAALSFPVLILLAAPLGLAMSQSASARILYGTSRLRWYSRALLAEAAANLLLSVFLVRPYGILGVALGTVIPNVVLNLVLVGYMCRVLCMPVSVYLKRAFAAPVACALGLAAFWQTLVWRYDVAAYPRLAAIGFTGVAAYVAVMWLFESGPWLSVVRRGQPIAGRDDGLLRAG